MTLTWGSQPNIDLHVFEPNSHVYYSNRSGEVGFLDVDDTNGYGPVHYYSTCEKLIEGRYDVKLNFFSGSGSDVANVTIEAGTETFTSSAVVSTPSGSAGNASPPYHMGSVIVSKDLQSGAYKFEIK